MYDLTADMALGISSETEDVSVLEVLSMPLWMWKYSTASSEVLNGLPFRHVRLAISTTQASAATQISTDNSPLTGCNDWLARHGPSCYSKFFCAKPCLTLSARVNAVLQYRLKHTVVESCMRLRSVSSEHGNTGIGKSSPVTGSVLPLARVKVAASIESGVVSQSCDQSRSMREREQS